MVTTALPHGDPYAKARERIRALAIRIGVRVDEVEEVFPPERLPWFDDGYDRETFEVDRELHRSQTAV